MSVLHVPGGILSHVLPAVYHFISHGRNNIETDLSDTTNRGYVHALAPEGWRMIANTANMGTVASPTTYDGGGDQFWNDLADDLYAGQSPAPSFHFGFNGGPWPRPNGGSPVDAANVATDHSTEGATGVCADWLTHWQTKYPGKVKLVEFWNEPANTHGTSTGKSWFATDTACVQWATSQARTYRAALAAVARPEVLLAHSAAGSSTSHNGTGPFTNDVLGKGFVTGFPWGTDNIAGNAYTCFTTHAYANGSFVEQMNAMVCPFSDANWGTNHGGYLAAFDYLRSLLNANGGSQIPLYMSEWEPIQQWGGTGQGVAGDALLTVIGANRQARWNLQGQVVMDAMRDSSSLSGGTGDQFLVKSGSTWIRCPRYFGAKDVWGRFLKTYKRIVTVPMYAGDTATCTWTTSPGLTVAGSTTLSVQRHQAVAGYADNGNLAILLVDINSGSTAEQFTAQLPFAPTSALFTVCPAGQSLTANTPFSATPLAISGQTFTTGSNGVPSLQPGTTMLIELFSDGSGPPPPPPPPPPSGGTAISSVADDANDDALSGIWTTLDGSTGRISFSEANSEWEFVCGASSTATDYYEIRSAATNYDATSDHCWIQMLTANGYLQLHQQGSSTVYVGLRVKNGNLEAYKHVNAADVVLATVTWDSSTMAYVRVREDSGTTYWEYASDPSGDWTQHASATSPITMSQLQIRFGAIGTTASTTVKLDNLNTFGINSTLLGEWTTAVGINAVQDVSPPAGSVIGAWTTAVGVNATGPPVLSIAPVAAGTAVVGGLITVNDGFWDNGVDSITYQLQINDIATGDFSDVVDATSNQYTLLPPDEGHTFRWHVTATNANGSTVATSSEIGPVGAVVLSLDPVELKNQLTLTPL